MNVPSPTHCNIVNESDLRSTFVIEPFYPGYGTTIGNALRRVLLSSLEGTAISGINIKGVSHEFSTLPGVKEDFVDIVLNLKGVVVKAEDHVDLSSLRLELAAKGERVVTAGDVGLPTGVTILNPDHVILTLTSASASIDMEIALSRGRGFIPIESRELEDRELGFIAIDSLYSPVTKVGFSVEDVRVGQMTNYDKVKLEVQTNGVVSPKEAVEWSLPILIDQFKNVLTLVQDKSKDSTHSETVASAEPVDYEEQMPDAAEEETTDGEGEQKMKKRAKKKKEE